MLENQKRDFNVISLKNSDPPSRTFLLYAVSIHMQAVSGIIVKVGLINILVKRVKWVKYCAVAAAN